jgi:DNA modification methylase
MTLPRNRIKELRIVKAADLVPHEANWRTHPPEQVRAMRAMLKEIGIVGAIVARELPDDRLEVIDGHLRRDLDKRTEWPVLVTDLTAEESRLTLLTYDPIAAMAGADKAAMDELLASVHTDSHLVASLLEQIAGEAAWQVLNDPSEVVEVPAQVDRAAELQAKFGTARGQAWQIGPHRLVCGDCREKAVVGLLWRDGGPKIRLVWTDAPYGVAYADKNKFLNRSDRGNRVQKPITNDHLSEAETEALFRDALATVVEHCEPGAAVYATVPGGPRLERFMRAFNASGFSLKHTLVWVKNQSVIGMSDYHFRHEPVLYGWIENGPHYFTDDRTQDSVFEVDKPHSSDLISTMKPVELVARMILNSSRAGELVWDSFLGSGTTLLAAHQLGRVGYGAEINPENAAVCLERLAHLGLEPKLIDG